MLHTNQKQYSIINKAWNIKSTIKLKTLVCFTHTIQLSLIDAKMKTLGFSSTKEKVEAIIGHYKHNSKATERL